MFLKILPPSSEKYQKYLEKVMKKVEDADNDVAENFYV